MDCNKDKKVHQLKTNDLGFMFYDSLLKKPIWWDGTAWTNVDGSTLA